MYAPRRDHPSQPNTLQDVTENECRPSSSDRPYIDVTFITDHADRRRKACGHGLRGVLWRQRGYGSFCCAKLGIVPDLIATMANDWLGRMFRT
jgi:hypothetical protein